MVGMWEQGGVVLSQASGMASAEPGPSFLKVINISPPVLSQLLFAGLFGRPLAPVGSAYRRLACSFQWGAFLFSLLQPGFPSFSSVCIPETKFQNMNLSGISPFIFLVH